jgi:hypothetical protein
MIFMSFDMEAGGLLEGIPVGTVPTWGWTPNDFKIPIYKEQRKEFNMKEKSKGQLEKERILELVSAMLVGEKVYCDNGGPFPSDINGPFEKFASSVKLHGGDKYLTQTELDQREDKEKKEEELKALEDEILTLDAQKGLLLKKYEELLNG